MLKYTGHPLVDVGAATILAMSRKKSLSDLTARDLDKMADFIEENYPRDPLRGAYGMAFTTNAWFNQPAFKSQPAKQKEYARRVLRGYLPDTPTLDEPCAFTGEPAVAIAFSDGSVPGRAFRQHVPMTTGEDVINFHPYGDAGLPVSGKVLLCLQAAPLGCAKCGGKLLAVHSDNTWLTEKFAAAFLQTNRKLIDLAREKGDTKLPGLGSAKTVLVKTFLAIEEARQRERAENKPSSVTAYYFSNSGQSNALDARNPPLEIYHLPLEIVGFLAEIVGARYRDEWRKIEQRAWQISKAELAARKNDKSKKSKARAAPTAAEDEQPQRNYLYEDLFRLPANAATFIRRYFLRIPARNAREDDPRRQYSLKNDAALVSWKLTQLFLERIVRMKSNRIERIRELGDQLATYVHEENDTRFFQRFYAEQKSYALIRNELIRVNHARLKRNQPPLIQFAPYIEIFEDVDENGKTDWRLARDLVLIRMIEKLYELRWIEQHADALPEPRVEEAEAEKASD
jgi:CRISPR-associated protein Cst1